MHDGTWKPQSVGNTGGHSAKEAFSPDEDTAEIPDSDED